jgi:integrase
MGHLTAAAVKYAKPGARLSDGGGLRLDVDRNGNRSWIFRFKSPLTGKERYAGLGSADDVSLADARAAADEARAHIRKGIDPIAAREAAREAARSDAQRAVTFEAYAGRFIDSREAGWRNTKHKQQWRNSLRDHAYPIIGALPISDVDVEAVLRVLRPIWNTTPETANRVRGRIEMILSAAKAEKLRTGDNPASWRGNLDHLLPSRKKARAVMHHPALPYAIAPAFWKSLSTDTSEAARVLRFIMLTVARYGEAASADWREIDLERELWTVPAAKMKASRDHIVPLCNGTVSLLNEAKRLGTGKGLIFPSPQTGRLISDVSLANCIKRHTNQPATVHGFRSTFRDWAGDCTEHARETAEAALAHAIGDETEKAYRRGSALTKRRALMADWFAFLSS